MEHNISLEFATNLFGTLKPEIKLKLQKAIDNPCQKTWNDAYCLILNSRKMITLWQSVIKMDPTFNFSKDSNSKWSKIPDSETIKKAIRYAVFEHGQSFS